MLMFVSRFGFQPEDQLPLHMACSRPSGAVEIVKTLLKASGKDAKLTSDKVSKVFEMRVNKRIEELKNFPYSIKNKTEKLSGMLRKLSSQKKMAPCRAAT